ncbi:hypothetical protein [Phormidium tenue]|uniref:Uncharacterized protein n=1 Tax=Phormidium tenue NIES-30 TaxID=549789 RepID=A0A1U7JBL6_9CYAN|nr:hypothetical protein [Phormidium tenue]MBD2230019.1 hypothetical protein [Phormidium tenue FACHB-1052]OKH51135.1 hypothetical protein NIES30_03465 [Phormidium tenue NIES-30]
METIAIQVDRDVAKAYREAAPAEQLKIQQLLNSWFKQTMKRRSLDDIIRDMQAQAQANGLTPDILSKIL